eukprot:s1660_g2.t1
MARPTEIQKIITLKHQCLDWKADDLNSMKEWDSHGGHATGFLFRGCFTRCSRGTAAGVSIEHVGENVLVKKPTIFGKSSEVPTQEAYFGVLSRLFATKFVRHSN